MPGHSYTFLSMVKRYLRYYLFAQNGKGHGIHSPFVYDFVRKVLLDRSRHEEFDKIEKMRHRLERDHRPINLTDYGAGSGKGKGHKKSISQIAKSAAKPPRLARLLFYSAQYFKAETIIELGTSLGLTTAYLATANKLGKVYSMEGDPELAKNARTNLDSLNITNTEIITGNFDDQLGTLLERLNKTDMVYIDGNHRLEPTLRYFEQVLQVAGAHTVIILDDIHWSEEMEAAWCKIQSDPRVTASIDLFFLGYVFINPDFKERQHFTIRY